MHSVFYLLLPLFVPLLVAFSSLPPSALEELQPYLLPEKHPAAAVLDKLFADPQSHVNRSALWERGFRYKKRPYNHVIVASHPALKGYLIKTFTDEQPVTAEWINWARRIRGAELTQQYINEKGYENLFKVPRKWVYLLPEGHKRSSLLLVEDMQLFTPRENLDCWRHGMNKARLRSLYDLLQTVGLCDSVFPANIPFSRDGKLAFVDTEYFLIWPIKYERLLPFLSKPLALYWLILTHKS